MVGWHLQFNGHDFEQTQGDSEGQGSLVCRNPWGLKRVKHDWATEQILYLCFIFGYVIYFDLIPVKGVRFVFMCVRPVAPTPFVENISSSPLHYLCFFHNNQQTIFIWVYFWDLLFCSINLFVCLFVNTTLSSLL